MEIEATILGYDDKVDVACLTFNHSTYIQPIEFGDSDSLDKGTFVVAIGNPGGYDYYGSVTYKMTLMETAHTTLTQHTSNMTLRLIQEIVVVDYSQLMVN